MPLHMQSKFFIQQLTFLGLPPWPEMPVEEARRTFGGLTPIFGPGAEVERVEDIDHPNGLFTMRLYHPAPGQIRPAVAYFHGGGWVLGDRETHDSLCRHLASETDCAVVSVDYRLAPENPFPAAQDDCYAAVQYLADANHAATLDIDPTRIAVAGDSAGGNLAATTALRCRDDESAELSGQLLIYPVIETNFETSSYLEFAEGHGLTRETMQWFWEQYLSSHEDSAHPYAAPTKAQTHERLPAAHLITAECDVLRDEGHTYADLLEAAGVEVSRTQYDGMLHGFFHFSAAFDHAADARTDAARFLRRVLGHG